MLTGWREENLFPMEVVVTSECSGQLWNTCIWDPLTGTALRTFKGGISGPQALNIVGGDYLMSSLKDKPIIQVLTFFATGLLTNLYQSVTGLGFE